jgi:16S rRNA (uracil1498-N3)-methyltransferase
MARTDFSSPRLFIDAPLHQGVRIIPAPAQLNYLVNVLRLRESARVLVFNGREGEFAASLDGTSRKTATLILGERLRAQEFAPDVDYLFAPLKHARLDYVAQKAVEMGARRLRPVLTNRTQATRVNIDRLRANALEAAEQCGVIWMPEVMAVERLEAALNGWPTERLLVFCDEEAPQVNPIAALAACAVSAGASLLIGPEGGFDEAEREAILRVPKVLRISLGPRILRADTAAVAALALIQTQMGDW